jgi:hypothetical protein
MTGGGDRRHDAPDLDGGVGVARERTGVRNRMERNGGEGERQELSAPRRRRRQWRGGGRHRTGEAAHGFDEKDRFAFPPLAADERDKAGQRVDREGRVLPVARSKIKNKK